MSAIFKSAAMSLLSRALQTLLSKYLSEVDVEGVNLPSLYDSDGHSGWGVRLKNVKLRHGVKLRDLAGRPRRKQKKNKTTARQRRRKHTKARTVADSATAKSTSPESGSTTTQQQQQEEEEAARLGTLESNPKGQTHGEGLAAAQAATEPRLDKPATAATATSSWWFWRSSTTDPEPALTAATLAAMVPETGLADPPAARVDAAIHSARPKPVDPVPEQHHKPPDQEPSHADDDDESDSDDENENDTDSHIPFMLRLGKGGHVGVLDVRLVGSEIHVLVEDGFLIVEAVRVRPSTNSSISAGDNKTDAEAAAAASAAGPAKKPSAAAAKHAQPATVGDRVLAENALARYFSAIPNLLLRDLRIQVVIRDQVVDQDDPNDLEVNNHDDVAEFSNNDSIVEICVEFLSITDGGDFLGKYRYKDDDGDDDDDDNDHDNLAGGSIHRNAQQQDRASAHSRAQDRIVENEYMTKRIRTGRGPDGGIVVRIFPPGQQLLRETSESHRKTMWARYAWDSTTQYCLLRCSGLDMQSRLLLGTKEDMASSRNYWYADDYDYGMEFDIFAGVDYVAPAPQSLPPMVQRQTAEILEDKFWEYEGAATYHVLDNGIQYSSMKSAFHRVARGMLPNRCQKDHLPCEYCSACWDGAPDMPRTHPLDNATPMPGFVLSIITRDPLEVNVDRTGLAVLGDFVSLLQKPPANEKAELKRRSNAHDESSRRDPTESEYEESSRNFNLSKQSLQVNLEESSDRDADDVATSYSYNSDDDDIESSFPAYMLPEKIQILGLHLSEIQLRVHVMQNDDAWDQGLAYCYWDAFAKCVTMGHQKLTSSIKSYSDLRMDIGHVLVKEYKGALVKQLVSSGLRQKTVAFDEATIETMRNLEDESNRSPWPSTAAALLDMQPPLETLSYEERDRHAIQFRFLSATSHLLDKDLSRSLLHTWVGPSIVNIPWTMKDQIPVVIDEARRVVEGPPRPEAAVEVDDNDGLGLEVDSLMRYRLHLDGGSFKLEPKFDIRLPLTTLAGERSPGSGIFLETILERVSFKFNEPAPSQMLLSAGTLSLQQIVSLPEKTRLSILLFLDDLGPLSRALYVKQDQNSFLMCNAVNKALVKIAKRVARRKRDKGHEGGGGGGGDQSLSRRQELMTELLKLDDDSLEQLWRYHMRFERRQNSNATPRM